MRILLVQTAFLGDVVTSTPLIGALKELYPSCELWFMTTPAGAKLVDGDKRLKGVIAFDKRGNHRGVLGTLRFARVLREYQFDSVYSVHRSFRTAFALSLAAIPWRRGFHQARGRFFYTETVERKAASHDVLRNLSLLSPDPDSLSHHEMQIQLPSEQAISDPVREALSGKQSLVCLVPGSRWLTKRWHWSRYRALAEMLLSQNYKVLVLGAPDEIEVAQRVSGGLDVTNLCGKTSIPEMALCIERASVLVCNDSLALHVGSAVKTPTVAIFCATSPLFGFGPWKTPFRIVEKQGLSCKPCRRHGSKRCPTGTESCMRELSEQEVYRAVESLLNNTGVAGERVQ